MGKAHHSAYVTTLGRHKAQRRLQLAVLVAMSAGTPLVAGQLGEKRVHSATLAAWGVVTSRGRCIEQGLSCDGSRSHGSGRVLQRGMMSSQIIKRRTGAAVMKAEFQTYVTEPDGFWQNTWRYGGGYDVMERAVQKGWRAIAGWGSDGWTLGSWPYVIIFHRDQEGQYDLAYYVEGDVTMYRCPTKELRNQVTDELAFFHWKHRDEEWVDGYDTVEQLPADLRGPYRED